MILAQGVMELALVLHDQRAGAVLEARSNRYRPEDRQDISNIPRRSAFNQNLGISGKMYRN